MTLRIAAVGAGRATRELTFPAFRRVKHGALVALCDPQKSRADMLAQKQNISAYTNMAEMIEREHPDVVIVNTPVATHASLAVQAMEMGVHVIIEKPAVASLAELDAIKRAAEQTGKKWTVVHNYKFYQGPQEALRLYQEGVLGEILHVDRYWMSPPQHDRMESDQNGWWHQLPGGRLADALPHMLYIPYMFVGGMELLCVSARKMAADRPWSVADESHVLLQTPRAYVNIRQSTNMESWPYKGYIYHTFLYGTKLALMANHHEAVIIGHGKKGDMKRGIIAAREYLKEKLGRADHPTRGAHNRFYDAFFLHVLGDGENPSAWNEIQNVAALTDAIGQKMQECIDQKKDIVLA